MADYSKAVPADVQKKVRKFFEVYDPERLESSDFNVLLRYITNKGLAALEAKLLNKYGVNIASMEKELNRPSMQDAENLAPQENDEPSELDNLPPPPEPKPVAIADFSGEGYKKNIGKSPDGMNEEDPRRAKLFYRLTEFYKVHNKDKLRQGIGDVVEYAMTRGEDRINQKLLNTYGEDLLTFEKNRERKWRQSAQVEATEMLEEEKNVLNMAPARQQLRQKLIDFFMLVEPSRAELRMDPLLDYAEKNGTQKLDEKLFNKYGYNLTKPPPSTKQQTTGRAPPVPQRLPGRTAAAQQIQHRAPKSQKFDADLTSMKKGDLPDYVRSMLGRYYAKYDQEMLDEGGVEAVYEWTSRNGLDKLNDKLAQRYGQSLQEFIQMSNDLRDDLIEFYRHRDKNKLVVGIQAILDWGLRNGRTALNEKLKHKYGVDLDLANEIYDEVMESASQF